MRQIDLLPPTFHAELRCKARRRRDLLCCIAIGAVLATAMLAVHAGAIIRTAEARPGDSAAPSGNFDIPAPDAHDHRLTTDDTWERSEVERHQEFAR